MSNVFHLSEAASIGLHCCVLMAGSGNRLLSAREISGHLDVSYDHTVQVLQRLRRAGMVASTQGPQGGFRLVRDPGQTTLLMVYEALEGELSDRQCLFQQSKRTVFCPAFRELLNEVNRTVREFFSGNTLKKLAGESCRTVAESVQKPVAPILAKRRMHIRRRSFCLPEGS